MSTLKLVLLVCGLLVVVVLSTVGMMWISYGIEKFLAPIFAPFLPPR